ncbi:multidrug effflux MFS transporter [Dyadobacter tibetensis]|uniref:multidrug effflux MFS transporter n=1 Tax=Dyadobacter tibetensis TaxID=1211851 RepID=UPI000470EE85|nr:multidrug effflux MFS transporter [Dyadobacter tibetensis]
MSKKRYSYIILILGALATISPFSIDMYLPGFPAIAVDLGTSINKVQLSLTSYLIGISIGQLIYGPLLDRFGRKTPLYGGLIIYILASIGCAFTNTVESLVIMRFLQAMGGCVGLVASQALVSDLFPTEKRAQVFSTITLVIAVSPMIAPTLGGYVTVGLGWHWLFIILAVIVALMIGAIYFFLPTGKVADPTVSLKPKAVLGGFATVLRQPQFLVYTLAGGLATAAPFAYIAGSSDVFMNQYQLTEQQYGWVFALLASAMIGSTQMNHLLLKRWTSQQIIRATLYTQSIVGIFLILGVWAHLFDMYSLIAVMFVFLMGQGLTGPNTAALALAPFKKHTGSASAMLGSWRMGAGALTSASVSMFHSQSALPMVGLMAVCSLGGLAILMAGSHSLRTNRTVESLNI